MLTTTRASVFFVGLSPFTLMPRTRPPTPPPAALDAPAGDAPTCRVCYEGADTGPLLAACRCKGGLAHIHSR